MEQSDSGNYIEQVFAWPSFVPYQHYLEIKGSCRGVLKDFAIVAADSCGTGSRARSVKIVVKIMMTAMKLT